MSELTTMLNNAIQNSTFTNISGEIIKATIVQDKFFSTEISEHTLAYKIFSNFDFHVQINEHYILIDKIREILTNYVDSYNRIGIGFAQLTGTEKEPSITEFTKDIIKAAVMIGTTKIVDLISDWTNDYPIHFNECARIISKHESNLGEIENGIKFISTRESTVEIELIASSLGMAVSMGSSLQDHYFLELNCKLSPALS